MVPNNIRFKPLYERLIIKECTLHGKQGLFARLPIDEEEILGISHIRFMSLDFNAIEQDEFMNGWVRTPLGGFYHHSSTPNCLLVPYSHKSDEKTELCRIITMKPIKVGEEITCHYGIDF